MLGSVWYRLGLWAAGAVIVGAAVLWGLHEVRSGAVQRDRLEQAVQAQNRAEERRGEALKADIQAEAEVRTAARKTRQAVHAAREATERAGRANAIRTTTTPGNAPVGIAGVHRDAVAVPRATAAGDAGLDDVDRLWLAAIRAGNAEIESTR